MFQRRRGAAPTVALSFAAAVLLSVVLPSVYGLGGAFVLGGLALSALVGVLASWRFEPFRRKYTGTLEADERGVLADGTVLAPRQDLVQGYVQPGTWGPVVRLQARGAAGVISVHSTGTDDAEALLRALHLDAGAARLTFWAPSLVLVSMLVQFVAIAAWMATGTLAAELRHPLVIPIWIVLMMVLTLLPTRVITGADGVRVAWIGRGRFVPYGQVKDVLVEAWGLSLHLEDGRVVPIKFEPSSWWGRRNNWLLRALFQNQRAALEERVRQGLRAHVERRRDEDASALLLRGERTREEWVASLRALGAGESGYRSASVPRDVLWRVAENASARPDERVAAAVALRAKLSEGERAKLAGLAEATAAPRVRLALEVAARGDDDGTEAEQELAEVLAECEEESLRRRRGA